MTTTTLSGIVMHNGMHNETQRLLLVNDPTVVDVYFLYYHDEHRNEDDRYDMSQRWVKSICASTHIQRLSLSFDLFNEILDRINTNRQLNPQTATLYGTLMEQFVTWCLTKTRVLSDLHLECLSEQSRHSNLALLPALLHCLLLRPLCSKQLQRLSFCNLHVTADDLATLLVQAEFLQDLTLKQCVILPGSFVSEIWAARHVAQSFSSASCRSFSLGVNEDLQHNTSIERFKLWNHYEDGDVLPLPIVHSIADLFRKAFGLWRVVELENVQLNNGVMAILVQGLKASSMMLDELRLTSCRLDKAAVQELQLLYSQVSAKATTIETTLHNLVMSDYFEFDADVTPPVLQDLVERSSGLHELHIPLFDHCRRERRFFAAVMKGLTSPICAVTKLYIPDMGTKNMMTLIQAIPRFTSVTHAHFTFACDTKFKSRLLKAFRLNRSLVETYVNVKNGTCFDKDDIIRLRNYNQRNKYLPQVLQLHTTSVVKDASRGVGKLVPSLLAVATLLDVAASKSRTNGCDSSTMGSIHNVAALVAMKNHTGPTC